MIERRVDEENAGRKAREKESGRSRGSRGGYGRCSFVRSALWLWGEGGREGGRERAQRVYRRRLVDRFSRSSRVETTLRGSACSVLRALHIRTRKPYALTQARAIFPLPPFPPQGHACACKDTRGLITISTCKRKQRGQRGNGDANRKEDGRVGKFCVDFHRIQSDLVLVDAVDWILYRYLRSSMPMIGEESCIVSDSGKNQ